MRVPWFGTGERYLIAINDEIGPRTAPVGWPRKATANRQYKTADKAIRAGHYLLSVGGGW